MTNCYETKKKIHLGPDKTMFYHLCIYLDKYLVQPYVRPRVYEAVERPNKTVHECIFRLFQTARDS